MPNNHNAKHQTSHIPLRVFLKNIDDGKHDEALALFEKHFSTEEKRLQHSYMLPKEIQKRYIDRLNSAAIKLRCMALLTK